MRTTFFLCCYFIITLISFSTSTQSNSNRWVHPGILVSPTQIKHISQLALNNSTCTTRQAYLKALDSKFANLSYISKGPPTDGIIDCGSYSHPDYGCSAESMDSATAYLHALLFAINGTQDYAHVAISILNKYANGVKNYTNSNAPLQAAWSGMMFTKAAELIRHSRNGTANWSLKNINAFSNMLNTVMLPKIYSGSNANGNWELSMIDAMIGLAVFDENRTLFDHAIDLWKQRIPSYFYNFNLDGNYPINPPHSKNIHWNDSNSNCKPTPRSCSGTFYGQNIFNQSTSGVCQETCRDIGHTQFGLASALNTAETAFIQGVDLYSETKERLINAMEFHSDLLIKGAKGISPSKDMCTASTGTVSGMKSNLPTFVIGWNAFSGRMGENLPKTEQHIVEQILPMNDPGKSLIVMYETLTHGTHLPLSTFDAAAGDGVLDLLNALVAKELPSINKELITHIPQTYGDCTSKSPPAPCVGSTNLYYVHKSWEYKAIGRWITGLKSINISDILFSKTNNNTDPKISLTVAGLFGELPLSLYIGECFTFDQCSILWDNTHGCCGDNNHFKISIDAVCGRPSTVGNQTNYPIDHLAVGSITLDKFEIGA